MACENCNYTDWIEVDPSSPEEADTQQKRLCDCIFEEAEDYNQE